MQTRNIRLDIPDQNQHLEIQLDPFLCQLKANNQTNPLWQLKKIQFRSAVGDWQGVDRAKKKSLDNISCELELFSGRQLVYHLQFFVQKGSLNFHLACKQKDTNWVAVDFATEPKEHFIGFGERFDAIDQRGKELDLWVEDGATQGITYIPLPFFMSSKGYATLINSSHRIIARMATHDDPGTVSLRVSEANPSFTILCGGSFQTNLSNYTNIAGRPELPPAWVFGPWKSRDWQTADQQGIVEDIQQQISLGLPATVKLIDARWEVAYHSFRFDPIKFPDPRSMIEEIHANGNKLIVWITPWMAVDNEQDPNDYYYECDQKGYFLKKPNGDTYVSQMGMNPMLIGSCIDFTNPGAVAWYQAQLRYLIDLGADGFQTDFGEQVPTDAVFYDGRTGAEMHNYYPLLYNEITYQTLREATQPVMLIRSGWHGSQKHSVIWAGDQTSDFCLNSGMRSALVAGQNAGLSGFPFWSSDIGGYFGNPTDEVYMRWTQFGAFSPIMMLHGAGKREPWHFSEEALQNYKHFARLHTDLFPYIYTYAQIATKTGLPIMRAMVVEHESDPHIWDKLCEDQYCFGSELIVAPVHYGFSRTRPVYLPHGTWRDFWSGNLLEGGIVVNCRAEIDQIPVFVRTGAIIPYLDPSPQTLLPVKYDHIQQAGNDLRVDIYCGANGEFTLYDGTHFSWDDAQGKLHIRNAAVQRQISVKLIGNEAESTFTATCDGKLITVLQGSLSGDNHYARVAVCGEEVELTLARREFDINT